MSPRNHFINGHWIDGQGREFQSLNPYTGDVVWTGAAGTDQEARAALDAATSAFREWSRISEGERYAALVRFAEFVKQSRSTLIEAVAIDAGKPIWEAATEIDALVAKVAPTKEAQELRNSTRVRDIGQARSVTRFRPHGAVVVLGPFNFPASMANSHMMPALLAGNTVVVKPSDQTPLVAQRVFECWEAAGLPSGVVNLVQGDASVASSLIENDKTRGIFLTGSVAAGRSIKSVAAGRAQQPILALEMGGNSPLVVWDYDTVESAVFIAIQSAFISAGQRCSCARRLIVSDENSAFVDALVEATRSIKVGDPLAEESSYCGPLISQRAADHVLEEQARLLELGAKPLVAAARLESKGGALLSPGILDVTRVGDEVGDDEVFGPLLKLYRVGSFEDAMAQANSTRFGLAAGLVSKDRGRYEEFLHTVEAGIINWNQQLTGAVGVAPFGGVKNSGNYRPGGFLAADYSVYATASLEVESPIPPDQLPPGLSI